MNKQQRKSGAVIILVILSLITIFGLALNFHKFIPPEILLEDTTFSQGRYPKVKEFDTIINGRSFHVIIEPGINDTRDLDQRWTDSNWKTVDTDFNGLPAKISVPRKPIDAFHLARDPTKHKWRLIKGDDIGNYPPDSTPIQLRREESIETPYELVNRICWKKIKTPGKGKWWLVDVTDGYHCIWFDTMANYRLEDQQGFTVIKSFAWPGCWEKEPNPDSLDSYIKRSNSLWLAFNPKKEGRQ